MMKENELTLNHFYTSKKKSIGQINSFKSVDIKIMTQMLRVQVHEFVERN